MSRAPTGEIKSTHFAFRDIVRCRTGATVAAAVVAAATAVDAATTAATATSTNY